MDINILKSTGFKSNLTYIVKCLTGVIICYVLYKQFPAYPFYWSIVSVALAFSPDNSNRLAYDRMKANALGCFVGICLYPIQLYNLLLLCIGVVVTISLGLAFNITSTIRSALAALIIVTLQVEQGKHWYIALERVVCVVVGCLVALLVTLCFNLFLKKKEAERISIPEV